MSLTAFPQSSPCKGLPSGSFLLRLTTKCPKAHFIILMKNLCLRALALPVTASLVFTSLPLRAQLAASGTAGDRAVYTIGSGATLATGFGTSVDHPFATTTIADTADSFDLQAGGAVALTAGHHAST